MPLLLLILLILISVVETNAQGKLSKKEVYLKVGAKKLKVKKSDLAFPQKIVDYKYSNQSTTEHYISLAELIPIHCQGFVILKFKKKIKDVREGDIYLLGDNFHANIELSVSNNLENWIKVGTIPIRQNFIELEKYIAPEEHYKYLKIKNLNKCGEQEVEQTVHIEKIALLTKNKELRKQKQKIRKSEIRTSKSRIHIRIKDFRYFDGDRVSVSMNGRLLVDDKLLTIWNRNMSVKLKKGENTVRILAHKEGLIDLATIRIILDDQETEHTGVYKLRKGKTKTIKIYQE